MQQPKRADGAMPDAERRPAGLARRPVRRTPTLPTQSPPLAYSILWSPASDGAAPAPSDQPVFVTQGTLREISRHLWTMPDQDVLGFLLGQRFESAETGLRFVMVTATTRSSYVIAEDGVEQIPEEAWHAAHLEARRRRLTILGWYRSAPYIGALPTARDLRSHRRYFPEPWHVGLVAAPRADKPAGGIFRLDESGEGGHFLPFYEVADEDAILPDGQKRTVLAWENYEPDEPPARTVKMAEVRPRIAMGGTIPILLPKGHAEEQREGTKRAKPRMGMSERRRKQRRRRLFILLGTTIAIVAAVAMLLLM